MGDQGRLDAVVGGELGGGHEDGAHAVWPDAAEEGFHTFFFGHADEAVDGVLVVPPVCCWERCIVLHADVEHIGWVAHDAAEEAGGRGDGDQEWHLRRAAWCGQALLELFVDTEAGCRVCDLAKEGGRETGVETCKAIVLYDMDKGRYHSLWCSWCAGLEADLGCC